MFDFDENILLENENIRLEPLSINHLPLLEVAAFSDKSLLQYSPKPVSTKAHLETYIIKALADRVDEFRYPFVILKKDVNSIVGSTSFGNVSNRDKRIEIGWTWIDKLLQGKGINKQVKFLMLTYVFETLEFERLEFKIDARNLQSRRAVEKIGGTFEGQLRSHTLMNDGFRRDTVFYSILKPEWPKIKQEIFSS